jgi:hypothetical protein
MTLPFRARVLHYSREASHHPTEASDRLRARDAGSRSRRVFHRHSERCPGRRTRADQPRVFVAAEQVAAAFRGAPRIARTRFRRDVDSAIEQDRSQA